MDIGEIAMVTISDEALKFINELLEKNDKKGYGIRIYLAGMACSGPQFGMAFQDAAKEGDIEEKMDGFSFYFDDEAKMALDGASIDLVETANGSGLIIQNPNVAGCSSCGGSCE
jgi:iron-sulfur cluster assembly accessory protein